MSLHEVCKLAALELDVAHPVMVDGRAITLFRLEDGVFALRDRCTHGNGRLSEGYVEGGVVECPLHAGCFDIRTGQPLAGPPRRALPRVKLELRAGQIYAVEVDRGVL